MTPSASFAKSPATQADSFHPLDGAHRQKIERQIENVRPLSANSCETMFAHVPLRAIRSIFTGCAGVDPCLFPCVMRRMSHFRPLVHHSSEQAQKACQSRVWKTNRIITPKPIQTGRRRGLHPIRRFSY
jgi:hypothetical protein